MEGEILTQQNNNYIAFLDSGMGGVSVLAQARALLPEENFIYYADIANAPYGNRPAGEVRRLVSQALGQLLPFGLKALLLACNTATSASVAHLRRLLTMPVLGMEPALKPALASSTGRVLVLGTALTIQEEKFCRLFAGLGQDRDIVPLACPLLVDLIEESPENELIAPYLQELINPWEQGLEAIVLGCTHYVFLRPLLQKLYPSVRLFDGNEGVSRRLDQILKEKNLQGGSNQTIWLSSLKGTAGEGYLQKCREFHEIHLRQPLKTQRCQIR